MKETPSILYLVLPCYNEEAVLPISIESLTSFIQQQILSGNISPKSRALFVNDGSIDKSWDIIANFHQTNPLICGINLSGNVGHQNALLAGMETAKDFADVIVTLDADLQDDITKIPEMVELYEQGCDIVYGVKKERKADSFFKRTSARFYYRLMDRLGVKTVYNHADFRLMSRRAVEQLFHYQERNLYLRGIIPLLGYKTGTVYEELRPRAAGESKYTFRKMINLAINGITSFSIKPPRLVTALGVVFLLLSIIIFFYVIISRLRGAAVSGWSSLILSLWFIGGCILIGLGIIGEYVGRIYLEVKNRPRYNIEKKLLD